MYQCYKIVEEPCSWDSAVDVCKLFCDGTGDAHLATIECDQEQAFITESKF